VKGVENTLCDQTLKLGVVLTFLRKNWKRIGYKFADTNDASIGTGIHNTETLLRNVSYLSETDITVHRHPPPKK
jgi:glycyl-tRNA synthetase alpha subunit